MKFKFIFTTSSLITVAITTALLQSLPIQASKFAVFKNFYIENQQVVTNNTSDNSSPVDTTFLRTWPVCTIISDAQVQAVDTARLFTASFIDESTKARMMGRSYRADCRVPLADLRLLRMVHCNAKGQTQLGEMVCNKLIAQKLLRIFRRLYENGYPIEQIRLIDDYEANDLRSMAANNTSCFCYREIVGSAKLSKHSLGLAVDLNPLYNPYVFTRSGRQQVQPIEGTRYAYNRSKRNNIPYKIDRTDLAYRLFKAEGFIWGGDWRSMKDYQHFEHAAN